MRNIAIDVQTAQVVSALQGRGVETLLLKGPALARVLYADGEQRSYCDSDLLVPARQLACAEQTLHELGYASDFGVRTKALVDHYGYAWRHRETLLSVDLHHTLAGVQAPPEALWDALLDHTATMTLRGTTVRTLDGPALAFHVALHAAWHGVAESKPLRDLERAVECFDAAVWRTAAELAERVDAVDAFGAGLRIVPQGSTLAAELGVPANRSRQIALRAMAAPSLASAVERLRATPGVRAKLALVTGKVCPPADFMRTQYAQARKGRIGLALTYPRRLAAHARQTVPAVLAWRTARRATASPPPELAPSQPHIEKGRSG